LYGREIKIKFESVETQNTLPIYAGKTARFSYRYAPYMTFSTLSIFLFTNTLQQCYNIDIVYPFYRYLYRTSYNH